MKQLGLSLVLLFVAVTLFVMLYPLGLAFTLLVCIRRWKGFLAYLADTFFAIALSLDQLGNVVMKDLFNTIFITSDGHRFGSEDETVSSVLGRNKKKKTLRTLGKALADLLNWLDRDHVENAIGS